MRRLVGEIVKLGPGTYGVPGDEKRRWALLECLGRVMECDVGKRVYDMAEPGERVIYQCENAEQRDARLASVVKVRR